jgi:hypothetical protein
MGAAGTAYERKAMPADVEKLVTELTESGKLDQEAVTDLMTNYLEVFRKGTLDEDDIAFLEAFHERILNAQPVEPESDDPTELRDLLDAAIARAERAEVRVAELEAQLAAQDAATHSTRKDN